MNRDFLNEAIELFDTPEKWSSFLELTYKKDEMIQIYFNKLQNSLNRRFSQDDKVQGWRYLSINNGEYRWFLNDFEKDSLYISFNHKVNLYLWANGNNVDLNLLRKELSKEKYSCLYNLVDRIDYVGIESQWEIIKESGNFSFGSPYDGIFTVDKIAWYAGNKTEEFVQQIAEKVNRIRKNPELTELLRELNETCKKK